MEGPEEKPPSSLPPSSLPPSLSYDKELAVVVSSVTRDDERRVSATSVFGGLGLMAGLICLRYQPILGAILFVVGVIGIAVGASPRKLTRTITRKARVRVSPVAINVEGMSAPILANTIAQAYFQPRKDGRETIRCIGTNGSVLFEAEVDGEAEAVSILRALGRDPAQRRAHFPILPWSDSTPLRRLFSLGAALGSLFGVLWLLSTLHVHGFVWLASLAALVGLAVAMSRGRIEIGTDGLLMSRLGRRRFLAYDQIRSVVPARRAGNSLHVVLTDGTHVALNPHGDELGCDALHARIEEARNAYRHRMDAQDLVDRVARGARSPTEWRADLEKLNTGEGGYREVATRYEDLWRLVEDPGAPEDARAAAALVLRKKEDATPRLRIAAEAVASPRLRVALETVADPEADEEAIDDVLAGFDAKAEEAAAKARRA